MEFIKQIVKDLITYFLTYINRRRYIKNYKECIAIHPELGKPAEGEAEWLQKWKQYDKKISPMSYRIFSRYIGADLNIIPLEVCVNIIEPVLTPSYYNSFYDDKNSFGLLYSKNDMPITFIRNIAGIYYSDNYEPIDGDILKNIYLDEVIVKPSTESSGRGVALFTRRDGVFYNKDGCSLSREYLDKEYKSNFLIQERFYQSDYMAQFNPTSVNTIRIAMYKNPLSGEIQYLRGMVRIGGLNSIVDNAHAGGRFIGIDDNGVFGKYVCDNIGNISTTHGNIDFSKNYYAVPNYSKVREFAVRISKPLIHHNLLALDIMLDKNNNPKMLEVNVGGFGAWAFQFTSGSAFREYTDSIMKYCVKEVKKKRIKIV